MRLRGKTGFTLIEMIIVVCLISILLAITLPSFHKAISKHKFERATQEFLSDIRFLQQQALAKSYEKYIIELHGNLNGNYYTLKDLGLASNQVIKKVYLPAGVKFDDYFGNNQTANYTLTFSPNGNINNGVGMTIKVYQTDLKRTKYIIISPITSRVRLSDSPSNT